MGPFSSHLNYRIVGKRFSDTENTDTLPSYQLVNGNLGFSISMAGMKTQAKLQILNMFDQKIVSLKGYPLPGRELRLTLGLEY